MVLSTHAHEWKSYMGLNSQVTTSGAEEQMEDTWLVSA